MSTSAHVAKLKSPNVGLIIESEDRFSASGELTAVHEGLCLGIEVMVLQRDKDRIALDPRLLLCVRC